MEKQEEIRALITSAQNGDRDAFEKLISRIRGRVRALVASRMNAHVVLGVEDDDVYQESILRAYKSLGGFDWQGNDSFLRWMGGIVENVILELARSRAREKKTAMEGDVLASVVSPSRAMRRDERFDRLEESLEKLSPEHREVVLLTRIKGLSFEDTAVRMKRSPDAVKQLLYRALKHLKSTFGDTESFHLPDRAMRGEERHGK